MKVADDVIASVEDTDRFQQVFDMCALELMWNRVATCLYFDVNMFAVPFAARIGGNLVRYIESIAGRYDFLV